MGKDCQIDADILEILGTQKNFAEIFNMWNTSKVLLQKFYVAQLFSTCGNTAALKLGAHTKGIRRTHVKFCSDRLKITRRREK